MVKASIVNVVATASLGQEIDLYDLEKFREIRHDPEVYGGRVAYLKLPTMKGKVSLFSSGKMISVGTRSEEAAKRELTTAKDFLVDRKVVKPVQIQPKTQNIVAVAKLEEQVSLEELAKTHRMIYEPEQFPGGILKLDNPKATILVFASGRAVITGLTSFKQLKTVAEQLETIAGTA